MAESPVIVPDEQLKPDHAKPMTDIDNINLFHYGSIRCSKCVSLVQRVAEVGDNCLDDDLEDIPGHMDRKKVSKFPRRKRRYESDSLCSACKGQISSGQYHKLGHHLLEAHDARGMEDKMPSEGCCWFCLLLFQLKCKNDCLQSANTLSADNDQRPLSLGLSWFWNLQLFSSSLDEPLRIDQYLPQGLQQTEMDSIRIVPWKKIHWPLVKSWLRSCEEGHLECNRQPLLHSNPPRPEARIFIDVNYQKLVTHPYDCRYVALSYVWGGIPQLLLTKSNTEALFRDGALKELGKEIPQVIRDAMQVVGSIGERLLWVDSLCIVQDDDLEKDQLISEMASIYSGALVTIIAATGENADFVLPGVRENSRVPQDLVEAVGPRLSFTPWMPLDFAMTESTYSTRGWTFQERLLSRRCLYFTSTQVFFECQKHLSSEDRTGKQEGPYPSGARTPKSGNLINRMLLEIEDSNNKGEIQMLRYSKLVEEYCQKKLTFPNDILKAFAGIESAMEHLCGWTMIYGLPKQALDCALLWEAGKPRTVREATNPARFFHAKARAVSSIGTAPIQLRNSELPSWSWAAWMGDICYNEWISTDLRVLHSPFKLVHSSTSPCTSQRPPNKQLKPSILSFSSECLSSSTFSLRDTIFRDKHTCLILNSQGCEVGTIPGVEDIFAKEYESSTVDMVLLSASKLGAHRFRSLEDMGYPSVFDSRYSREEWSIFTIMIVKWGKGYAKRIALGYIHRDAWKDADPKVKDVLLA